jgi:hypothetical protein
LVDRHGERPYYHLLMPHCLTGKHRFMILADSYYDFTPEPGMQAYKIQDPDVQKV